MPANETGARFTLASTTFRRKSCCCETNRPPVCARPSRISEFGITGKAGEVVVQMLFGQRHRFDCGGLHAHFEFDVTIDPEPTHSIQSSRRQTESRRWGLFRGLTPSQNRLPKGQSPFCTASFCLQTAQNGDSPGAL